MNNAIYLSPKSFKHFFSWWNLFSSVLSLPVKQGALFPSTPTSQKKFSRYFATLKYQLKLSPLFLTHIYRHKEREDWDKGSLTFTGIKGRVDKFSLDFHQRKQEKIRVLKELNTKRRTLHLVAHTAQVTFDETDLRVLAAKFKEPSAEDLLEINKSEYRGGKNEDDEKLKHVTRQSSSWIDPEDFVEIGWVLLRHIAPQATIFPLAYIPCFTYHRNPNDLQKSNSTNDSIINNHFGDEDSHNCLMHTVEGLTRVNGIWILIYVRH